MRVLQLLPFSLLLLCASLSAQQTTTATRDPQALSVLSQALTGAGGTQAIAAIIDYTATGNITYNANSNLQGNVILRGLGFSDFRLDATLPVGVRSVAILQGQLTEKTESTTAVPGQAPAFPSNFVLPFLQLRIVVQSPNFKLSYIGVVQTDGHSAYQIRVQRILPAGVDPYGLTTTFRTRDFFIDTTTFQVVMTQEALGVKHQVRKVHYADYRSVSGLLVPFSIIEEQVARQTITIQLDQINFNTGLQESAFEL
ncbi:MAG TPA: hypothetical protein VFB23_09905 [Candidatus Acidoferrales bacterium]|nr:hypothetical protein [Candidatus Acidoferrales bacterium]